MLTHTKITLRTLVPLLWCICLLAQNQNFERIAPRAPMQDPDFKAEEAVQDMYNLMGEESDLRLVDQLIGIQLVPTPQDLQNALNRKQNGINAINLSIPNEEVLKSALSSHLYQAASMSKLQQIAREITEHYQKQDRPVVTVVTPPQDISDGVVTFVVVDSKVSKVYASGAKYFDNESIADKVRLDPGDHISKSTLEDDLDYLNKNPFRNVSLIYEKGDSFGTTNLNLSVDDRFPLQAYTGYENNGNDSTGENRFLLGSNYGNFLGMEHELGGQISSSGDERFYSGALTYNIPFIFRSNIMLYGSYVNTDVDLSDIVQTGGSYQAGIRISRAMPSLFGLRHEVELGFDIKRSSSFLADKTLLNSNGNFEVVTDNVSKIGQIALRYLLKQKDKLGHTRFTASGYFSPGDLYSHNNDTAFNAVRADSKSRYAYGLFELDRTTYLPFGTSMVNSLSAQVSVENLLPTEQLFAGGIYNVRGYSESVALGDRGILFSTEFHLPPFSALSKMEVSGLKDSIDIYAFWDYANVEYVKPLDGESKSTTLSSVGIGMRYYIYPYFSLGIDYGVQLKTLDSSLEPDDSRLHISGIVSY